MLSPHLATAVRGALGRYLGGFDSRARGVTVTWLIALIPGQSGTTFCSSYDQVGHRNTDPSCPLCYGRGVVGGYMMGGPVPVSLIPGQTREVANPEGYLETQSGVIAYILEPASPAQPQFKRDDLLVVTPDPLAAPDNYDRRYVIADEIDPVHVMGHTFCRRYWTFPIELGAVAYRVPLDNPMPIPDGQWGTL